MGNNCSTRCRQCFEQQGGAATVTNGHHPVGPQPVAGFKNTISKGGVDMTNAIIEHFKGDTDFEAASARKLTELIERDKADGVKLQAGINVSINKGLLERDVKVEPVTKVNVTGKSPTEIATEIKTKLPNAACAVTVQGLSGLGKGTVVGTLRPMLNKVFDWSNGNIFRSITLLAVKFAIKERFSGEEKVKFKDIIKDLKGSEGSGNLKEEFDYRIKALLVPDDVLTDKNVKSFMACLSFDKFKGGALDTQIKSDLLESTLLVSEVQNTVLKTISPFIPAISQVTQGEVIGFIQKALKRLTDEGFTVLLEGREQTMNYIRTPYRFELVIDDNNVLGRRQAALMMGSAVKKMVDQLSDDAAVAKALTAELGKLAK